MTSTRRQQTEERLLRAVGSVLAKDGFDRLGVNRVARMAGVDKVLIYRYFGGLPELVAAYARSEAFWPTLDELMGPDERAVRAMTADEQLAFFVKSYLRGIRRRPQTQKIMSWRAREHDNDLVKYIEETRMRSALEFFERLERIPTETDLTAVVVILSAAINGLIEKAQTVGYVGGVDLTSEDGWRRIEEGIDLLVAGTLE